tara:strand:+ start:772 stop:1440 length:669 start_codon:yes stop_codon:yes gene_type:complete
MKDAIIIGNGNSTKQLYEYGFKNINTEIFDTYCTSLAFRFCDDLNFQPTYYVFSDPKSVKNQQNNLLTRIEKWQNTKEWYLCTTMSEHTFKQQNKVTHIEHNGSGPAALKVAIDKKIYNNIYIFGLDHNYTWIKDDVTFTGYKNCAIYNNDVLNHPSYFYPTYLRKGDCVSWDMKAKNGEKIVKHCLFTQKLIDDCKHSVIVDYSDSLLKVKKEKDISLIFN